MKIGEIRAIAVAGYGDSGREMRGGASVKVRPPSYVVTFAPELGGEIRLGVSVELYEAIMQSLGEVFVLTVSK